MDVTALFTFDPPVTNPTKELRIRVRNRDGSLHGAGALVAIFLVDSNMPVWVGETNEDSEVVLPRDETDVNLYYAVSWDAAGGPELQGVTQRGLTPQPL